MEEVMGFHANKIETLFLENSEYPSEAQEEMRERIRERKAFQFKAFGTDCRVVFQKTGNFFHYWFY